MRVIVIADYNSQWPGMFDLEANLIRGVYSEVLISLHHIGSTSVAGLKSKPIIDIMPVVSNIEVVDKFNDKMIGLGYEPMGEFGDDRTHHIHIFQVNSSDVERHLAFRDYLRQHKDDAKKYGELKELLAKRFPNDIEAYLDGKGDFVKNLEQKAIKWYRDKM